MYIYTYIYIFIVIYCYCYNCYIYCDTYCIILYVYNTGKTTSLKNVENRHKWRLLGTIHLLRPHGS